MTEYFTFFIKTKASKIVFILSVLVCLFWFLGQVIDVYHFPLVGAIFEILWFPIVAMTLGLPVTSFIFWRKEKFNMRSLYPYTILMIVTTILIIVFRN